MKVVEGQHKDQGTFFSDYLCTVVKMVSCSIPVNDELKTAAAAAAAIMTVDM